MRKYLLIFILISALLPNSWSNIIDEYSEAIVHIVNIQNGEPYSFGSGFVIDKKGIIVTNFHVIDNAEQVLVLTKDQEEYEVKGFYVTDSKKDYAIMKISAWDLPTVKLGNSKYLRIGEEILAIGHPIGLSYTVTNGIISQIRNENGVKLLQINAAIDHGSSGGALFNKKGEVIGITTSGHPGEDFNFAIPINYINGELSDLPSEYSSITNNEISYKSQSWNSNYGQEFLKTTIMDCMEEAQLDMGSKYYEHEKVIKEMCSCVTNFIPEVFATPEAAARAYEIDEDGAMESIFSLNEEKIKVDCVMPFLNVIEQISDESIWPASQKSECVQNCLLGDEYVSELGGTMQSVCGARAIKDHCNCYCNALEKINPNLNFDIGETDFESDQATLGCMDTELMYCLEKAYSYNPDDVWTYEFENNLINEWTKESYNEVKGTISYDEMRDYITCIVKKAKVYYSPSEMTVLMVEQGPEFDKLLDKCLYMFD